MIDVTEELNQKVQAIKQMQQEILQLMPEQNRHIYRMQDKHYTYCEGENVWDLHLDRYRCIITRYKGVSYDRTKVVKEVSIEELLSVAKEGNQLNGLESLLGLLI